MKTFCQVRFRVPDEAPHDWQIGFRDVPRVGESISLPSGRILQVRSVSHLVEEDRRNDQLISRSPVLHCDVISPAVEYPRILPPNEHDR
jgi:hypothetical protein